MYFRATKSMNHLASSTQATKPFVLCFLIYPVANGRAGSVKPFTSFDSGQSNIL